MFDYFFDDELSGFWVFREIVEYSITQTLHEVYQFHISTHYKNLKVSERQ
ncbi:Unknown protein sequence [Pseudomonas coronafaciens pv. garcae]|nr:Unknown protein sequence [Pseudomonas coronafaciens pv. garcae]